MSGPNQQKGRYYIRPYTTRMAGPFKLYWGEHTIDLSGKSLDGINYLKEFFPKLDSLTL
jgi:hypothetical protein